MFSSFQPPPSRQRKALLLFADSPHADCRRRGWPVAFHSLLGTNHLRFQLSETFDAHLFTSAGASRRHGSFDVHVQQGASFGERLENAISTLVRLGYREIVIVGQDCPDLQSADVRRAFELLDTHRLVLGQDHRGGCYLIGLHAIDASRLHAVRWRRNTDYDQILRRFATDPVVELPVKFDLDTWRDVRLLADSQSPFRWMALLLLNLFSAALPFALTSEPRRDSERKIFWQLPPPLRTRPA